MTAGIVFIEVPLEKPSISEDESVKEMILEPRSDCGCSESSKKCYKECVIAKFEHRFRRNWQLEIFCQKLKREPYILTRGVCLEIFSLYPHIKTCQSKVSKKCYHWWFIAKFRLIIRYIYVSDFFHHRSHRKIFSCSAVLQWNTSQAMICVWFWFFHFCSESVFSITSNSGAQISVTTVLTSSRQLSIKCSTYRGVFSSETSLLFNLA